MTALTPLLLGSLAIWIALAWFRRETAVALLFVLLPVYQIRFTIATIPFTYLEILILTLALTWVIEAAVKRKHVSFPHLWLVLAFIGVGALATAVSQDVRAGLGLFKAYILEPVIVYLVVVNTMTSKSSLRRMEWGIIGLLCIVSVVGVLQVFDAVPIPMPYGDESPQRITSLFPFPTAIGKLLGPLIGFGLAFLFYAKSAFKDEYRLRVIGWTVALGLGVFSLLASVNRGAILGVIASAFVLLFFSRRKALFLSLAILLIVGLLFVPKFQSEISDVLSRQDTSTDVRIVMWQGTWRMIMANPIFGAGLGGFPTLYDQYRDASHVELFPNPDNLLLTLWAELGLAGLAVFLWLCVAWMKHALDAVRQSPRGSQNWLFGLAFLAAFVAFFIHGFLDTPYFKNDLSVCFWMMFGMLTIIATKKFQERP